MALLARLQHERATDPRKVELLDAVAGSALVSDPLAPAAVNVREWKRRFARAERLPLSLVEELARITSVAQQAWENAHRRADFGHFRPWLERIVRLKHREADALGFPGDRYDALLDEYDPGTKSADLAPLFEALRREIVPLTAALADGRPRPDIAVLRGNFSIERQRIFAEAAAGALGFDFARGRLDATLHPFFCSIGPNDCRLTTRYCANDFGAAFFGTLHEVGHGLYEQGLDPGHHSTPMGEAVSLAVHESQARLWENTVGRSWPFWQHFFPRARQMFPSGLAEATLDGFYRAVNRVAPTPIRVGADEVTYNLHILVRFQLERALLADELRVADLPPAWNEAYRHYLGITPANDAEGCLQDSHWSAGLFGYFPTYTLGNLFAAQLFEAARTALGDLGPAFARGDFGGLLDWLRQAVYRQGHRYPADRLIEHATGSLPSHRPLVQALETKYRQLYGVKVPNEQ
jgi:carboxypeptidase Taq